MSHITTTPQLFIPILFTYPEEKAFTSNNCENNSHLRNLNNVAAFDSNRIKRRKRDVEPHGQSRRHVPWKRRECYSPGVVGLHEEILDFCDAMAPLTQEKEVRLKVVTHIQQTVHSLWPHAKVAVFGSFNTGLYLPTSDIDIVVTGKWGSLPLNTLRTALIKSGIDEGDINVLSHAAVPLVRLVHTQTKVKVDISFNVPNGVRSAELIKNAIRAYPVLPKLVLVLKQFLVHRGLNEVYYGGMSSYTLTLLVISFLQGHHKPSSMPVTNLGTLLIEFFELYGINFNYEKVSINVRDGGFYSPKRNPWGSYLSIEDPLCEGNDIAKGTYLMHQIKNAFENAYNVLHKAVTEPPDHPRPPSILQLILDVDTNVFIQRQYLIDHYDEIMKSFTSNHERDSLITKDLKENAAQSFISSADIKEPVVELKREVTEKLTSEVGVSKEKHCWPFQRTRVFYGSKTLPKNVGTDRNAANNPNNGQHTARSCYSSSIEYRSSANAEQCSGAKKNFKQSRRNFKQVTNYREA